MKTDKHNPIILVVDDSPDSLGMINASLDDAGYTVLISLNGQQALMITGQITPDVILMDAVMPVMDGFECCQLIRQSLPHTPIIFMTGLTETDSLVKAFESGGNDYVTKPIQPIELLARIKSHTSNARLIRGAQSALDSVKQFIFSVDDTGHIQWSTQEAHNLLEHIQSREDFFSSLASWLKAHEKRDLVYPIGNQTVQIRYFKPAEDETHLLRIIQSEAMFDASILKNNLKLTKRESEVLLWLAQGKSNKEIAEILNISPRTINKHLEQLFPKIDVDNRTSAAALAIRTLLGN